MQITTERTSSPGTSDTESRRNHVHVRVSCRRSILATRGHDSHPQNQNNSELWQMRCFFGYCDEDGKKYFSYLSLCLYRAACKAVVSNNQDSGKLLMLISFNSRNILSSENSHFTALAQVFPYQAKNSFIMLRAERKDIKGERQEESILSLRWLRVINFQHQRRKYPQSN